MFKDMNADLYLRSAGIASDWPYGRGCWQSADKQCIIWFGEEDHLRIMCMKKGSRLNEVFTRLKKMLDLVETLDGIDFARSSKYGYITSCPTNLGTGMRASVHIKVPNLTADGQADPHGNSPTCKAICNPLGLSVRGTGGEHTPIGKDGTIDLSPRARLFIKEKEIIAALYRGITNLMAAEKKAAAGGGFTYELATIAKVKAENPNNLAMKHFDPEWFAGLDDNAKKIVIQIVRTGFENPSSSTGCYAMTPKDYDNFPSFFDPVIREYHSASKDSVHVTDWDISDVGDNGVLDTVKLGLPELSMRVRVARNLKSFNLPGSMDRAERIRYEKTMLKAFQKLIDNPEYGGKVYSLSPDHGAGETNPNFINKAQYQV